MAEPRQESLDKMWKFTKGFAEKSGTTMHPMPAVTEAVVKGLAMHGCPALLCKSLYKLPHLVETLLSRLCHSTILSIG